MIHNILKVAFFFLLIPSFLSAQNLSRTWKQLPMTHELAARMDADLILPADTKVFSADASVIGNHLIQAKTGKIQMTLPIGSDGTEETFNIVYDPVMGPNNQAKFSDIMTFRAFATDGSGKMGRIGVSALGFYGIFESDGAQTMIRHGNGTDNNKIFVYDLDQKMALLDPTLLGGCGTETIRGKGRS